MVTVATAVATAGGGVTQLVSGRSVSRQRVLLMLVLRVGFVSVRTVGTCMVLVACVTFMAVVTLLVL